MEKELILQKKKSIRLKPREVNKEIKRLVTKK